MGLLHTLSFAPQQYRKKEEPAIAAAVIKTADPLPVKKETVNEPQVAEPKTKIKAKQKPKEIIAKKEADKKPVNQNPVTVVAAPEIKAAAAITKRKTEVIRNVFFTSDSLVLSLYDNGTVDGDTVSVVLNGEVIIAKNGLSANAIRTTIHLGPDKGDSLQLIMYAENLGAIPPNTGVLIIQDGNNRNEIRFAGDMQKSSAIILKRRR
jgi:hypothetical protein